MDALTMGPKELALRKARIQGLDWLYLAVTHRHKRDSALTLLDGFSCRGLRTEGPLVDSMYYLDCVQSHQHD